MKNKGGFLMKRFICLLLVCLLFPLVSIADDPDPIVGAWYIMLNYKEYPTAETEGKNYMIYIMICNEDGTIDGISAESNQSGLTANGSGIGKWENRDGTYAISIIGLGRNPAEFSGDRLLVQMTENIWYSMQRMYFGDWYSDLVVRY